MVDQKPTTPVTAAFERKVRLGTWSLLFERLWPRAWAVISVAGVFVLLSLAGLWAHLGELAHKITLGGFGAALLVGVIVAARVRWPSRDEVIRRIEARSGVPHRPASSYEDTLSAAGGDPATQVIWRAHKTRLAAILARLRVGRPEPRADRYDPWALRALMLLAIVMLAILAGDSVRDRLMAAFRIGPVIKFADARLDAWITPPAYTAKPPVLLADGARGAAAVQPIDDKPIEVPERSLLIVRTVGAGIKQLVLEVVGGDPAPTPAIIEPVKPTSGARAPAGAAVAAAPSDVAEARMELRRSGTVRVMSGRSELARWSFVVIPDQPPRIALTKDPERTQRGSLKLSYKVEDDYGLASAEARFQRLKPQAEAVGNAWAREPLQLKGPRAPLERPPVFALKPPRDATKPVETTSMHDTGSHLWAGSRVRMTLVAKDHAGQVGRSSSVELALPQRRFTKPLARAVIEQRRKLVEDPRYRPQILKAIDALTYEPDGYFKDRVAYLGLRNAYHRLERDKTRAGRRSVAEQLWHVALRLEDGGNLSAAERRLRDIQEQLSKALQEGASDQELQRLMQELRQALAEFMQQLQKQAEGQPPMEFSEQNQVMRQEDLERMLNNLENMARQGSRDQAQDMLSQMRELLEQLQSGRMASGQQNQQNQQMNQMMNQFGDIIGQQQRLQDDTFGEQRQQGERGQQGQQGQGQQGQGQQGQQPGQGQRGRGQPGQQGQRQPGQGGQPGQQGQPGQGQLGQRQGQLGDRLGQLRRGMQQNGVQAPGQLDGAQQSMENAQRALEQGDLETATREQGRALEQLRQGAQSMAEQMMRQRQPGNGSQFGMGPGRDAPRDPLGRPQRSEGADDLHQKMVPDAIDMQTAREILEELRRRLGETTRPTLELDYIERLLRRF